MGPVPNPSNAENLTQPLMVRLKIASVRGPKEMRPDFSDAARDRDTQKVCGAGSGIWRFSDELHRVCGKSAETPGDF